MSRILVCAVAAMLMTAARSLASDSQVERSSLAGLPTLSVVVEELPSVAQTNGLTVALLQADVERRVRQAGISVTPDADAAAVGAVHRLVRRR